MRGIRQAAGGVIADRGSVGCAVALASGLDPDDGVNERVAGTGGGLGAKPGAEDVAPVTPLSADVLNTRAALVNNEVGWRGTCKRRDPAGSMRIMAVARGATGEYRGVSLDIFTYRGSCSGSGGEPKR